MRVASGTPSTSVTASTREREQSARTASRREHVRRFTSTEIETTERRVCATRRDLFLPATVDPRPGRAVHCPDLNACLINQYRRGHERIDCQAVHYGYAIPVSVIPIEETTEFCQLVLDHTFELSQGAAGYLREHHPQLRERRWLGSALGPCDGQSDRDPVPRRAERARYHPSDMATTAKHDLRRKFPADSSSGDEDIAVIAKQISDHAEAIYQTWKSQGLAPTEILNCHHGLNAADKFGSTLTPTSKNNSDNHLGKSAKSEPSPVGLLAQTPDMDNKHLEKLVNNFVVEDKARIAASRQRSPSKTFPSSIQYALQKFEKNSAQSLINNCNTPTVKLARQSNTLNSVFSPSNESTKNAVSQSPGNASALDQCESFMETIETIFPTDIDTSKIFVQQKRPTSTMIAMPSNVPTTESDSSCNSGLTTWPLKNKLVDSKSAFAKGVKLDLKTSPVKDGKTIRDTAASNSSIYMDEVAREEERLISALKSGSVVTEEPDERSSISPDKIKPAIKRAKPKVEPIKPIILGHNTSVSNHNSNLITGYTAPHSLYRVNKQPNDQVANIVPISAVIVNNVLETPTSDTSVNKATSFPIKDNSVTSSIEDFAKLQQKSIQEVVSSRDLVKEQKCHSPLNRSSSPVLNAIMKFTNEKDECDGVKDELKIKALEREKERDREREKEKKERERNEQKEKVIVKEISTEKPEETKKKDDLSNKEINKNEKDIVMSRWGPRISSLRTRMEQVPHPELTTQQKQHIRAAAATGLGNPVRPFLTRGSVAERVLIFEKCPSELLFDKRGPRQTAQCSWKSGQEVYNREKLQQKSLPPHTTLQRHVKANKNINIPRFYFPGGKPVPVSQIEASIAKVKTAFLSLSGQRASRTQFHVITKACDLPLYWKLPLFLAVNGDQNGFVEMTSFLDFIKTLLNTHHDAASKFVRIITRGLRNHILPEDLIPLVQDVVETHPGLNFLKEAKEFHSRYVHTVIARIFYCVNRSWSGKISVSELRRSNMLNIISVLEHEEDINQVTAYFSYEHFYVIYCKFWELDRDHDLFIDKMDLARHNDHALSTRMIDRIFSGAVTRGGVQGGNSSQQLEDKMSYTEFVWFLLSEEDKNHPTAIEYWFRCMDLDGDGFLSMYELEYFYEEQMHRVEAIGMDALPFEDCLCQMLDMIHPVIPGKISLSDLKKCKMTPIFFDTFFNFEKYLDHEQRDPFASARDHDADGHELSDWDRFAAEEYELLVAEESGNEPTEQLFNDTSDDMNTFVRELANVSQMTDADRTKYSNVSSSPMTLNSKEECYSSDDSDDYASSDN